MCTKPGHARQRGLTLIELIMFIVIVGIAAASLAGVLNLTSKQSADPVRQKQALMLAEAILEEVELAQFTYCDPNSDNAATANSTAECLIPENFGPDAGNARPFDNVNDYGGASNPFVNGSGQLTDINGNALSVSGYSAALTIEPQDLNGIPGGVNNNPDVLHIIVTVSYDNGKSVRLDGYRTRYAPQVL
jgi:MSHA pilin protein MshD